MTMKYKRIAALLTAASLLFCGCSVPKHTDPNAAEQTETLQTDTEGSTIPLAEDVLTANVRAMTIDAPDELGWVCDAVQTADGLLLTDYSTTLFRFEPDSSLWTETELTKLAPYDGYYDAGGLVQVTDGAVYRLTAMENHNNMNPADGGDKDYDFWQQYWSDYVTDYWLCTYEPDGTLSGKVQITGLEDFANAEGRVEPRSLLWEDDGAFLSMANGEIIRIGKDGSVQKTQDAPEPSDTMNSYYVSRYFLHDRDGKALVYDITDYSELPKCVAMHSQTVYEFDTGTGKIGKKIYTNSEKNTGVLKRAYSGGYGDYRLFVNAGNTLRGIRDDGKTEVVIDWDASDLNPLTAIPLTDGSFLGISLEGQRAFYRLTRKRTSEIGTAQNLTLAVLDRDYAVKDFVQAFNREHSDIRITIQPYLNTEESNAIDQLKMDIVSDKAPDLVLMYGGHEQFLKLGSRGVFCDLNDYLNQDAALGKEQFVPNVLTAMQHPNGSLYALASGFVVETIAVKSKFTDKESWTVDDMLSLYDGADDIFYYWSTKEDALQMFLTGTDFTDEMAGTCSFDSPEFVKILEFCNRYPAETTRPEKNYEDAEQMRKFENWYSDNYMKYQRDQDYLYPFAISAPGGGFSLSHLSYVKAELGGEMTLAGYPSDTGQGGKITNVGSHYTDCGELGIVSTSPNRDAAWEVVKAYVQDAKEYNERPAFSLIDAKFEEQLDGMMYVWSEDKISDIPNIEDNGNKVYPLTQEERDALEGYIRGCDTFMMLDQEVRNIVLEEAGMYFSGDRSAEDTAEAIQKRAALYLAEQN